MRLAWPLTGRNEQLRFIEAVLGDDDFDGVVICGPAGVGKSRIAREALRSCADNGCETRWAVGTSSARKLPAGAFAAWVKPEVTDSLKLVRSVIDALTSTPDGGRVVVGVDDVHLLDDLSTFVVHQIVHRRAAKVVLTVRDGDPVSPATREIWNNDRFEWLDLPPLSRDETTSLLTAALGPQVDHVVAQTLWTLTHGNVLYLRNIVEHEIAGGRLTQQQARWVWAGQPTVPPNLVEMVESRIGMLPAAVGDVVDALAVGEPIELMALGRITDPAAVEEAERRGLIALESVNGDVEVRLAHPLYGEIRRGRAAATSLRRLRGLVAAELAKTDSGDDVRTVVRRATLVLESDREAEADLLLSAARGAVWLADLPLADRLAEAAIRAGAGSEANFVRAHVLSFMSRGEEAVALLAACPPEHLSEADVARLAFLRSHITFFARGDPAEAKRLIDDAAQTTSPSAHSFIDAFLALYWSAMGKPQAALELSARFELDELPGVIGAGTSMAMAVAYGVAGRTAEALAAADTGYAIAGRSFDAAQMRFIIADGHIGALLQAGRIGEAREIAKRLHQQAADVPGAVWFFSGGQVGMAELAAGRLDTACESLGTVVEAFGAASDTTGWGYRYSIPYAIALALRGSVEEATAAVTALEERRHPSWRYLDYEHMLAQSWVSAVSGGTSSGIAIALRAAENCRANGQFAAEVLCLQTATQLGDASFASRLRELAVTVEGPRVGLAARYAAALRAQDGHELHAVSTEYEKIGDLVAAVDAAAHAAGAYRSRELRGSAHACAARAHSLAAIGGGITTPALSTCGDQLPLSRREREIVMLLADGSSSRAVAERLTLSVRTVEGHIYRAMAKTGARSRAELVAMVDPRRRRL